MVRLVFKVAGVDLVIVYALASVLQDLSWRVYYAGTPHAGVPGFAASFSYSLLARFFTMARSGVSLTSPPTLDWVQILELLLILVNGWFVYVYVMEKRHLSSASGRTNAKLASLPA